MRSEAALTLVTDLRSVRCLRNQISAETRLQLLLAACQSRVSWASESWWTASCRNTSTPPHLCSLLLSCVLVGWFETSRSALWINEVCQTAADFHKSGPTQTSLLLAAALSEFLLRWELVVLKMDSRTRRCLPSGKSESDRRSVASRPPEDTQTLLRCCRTLKSDTCWGILSLFDCKAKCLTTFSFFFTGLSISCFKLCVFNCC